MNFLELFRDWEDIEVFRARTVIFSERDPADIMYVILSGEIELTLHGEPLGAEPEPLEPRQGPPRNRQPMQPRSR
jgi:hypothetical protein